MTRSLFLGVIPFAAILSIGCASATPAPEPPPRPPTPTSITRQNPGGDAEDPERAALERLLREPWGGRSDRFGTLHLSVMDAAHWERVKLIAHPTRVAYRFGDDHYGILAV